MARLIRLWEKKRGDRKTGSPLVGSLGEGLFFGLLLLLGLVSLCALIVSHVVQPRPDTIGVGFYLLLMVLTSFVIIGGIGTVYTLLQLGTSAERRSALARKATQELILEEKTPEKRAFPTVPDDENFRNSPGVRLTYRLPVADSGTLRLGTAIAFCVVWNALTVVLVLWALTAWLTGENEWRLNVLSAVMLVVGITSIYYLARLMLFHTGIGPTNVEISDHPLVVGGSYEVFLSQTGQTLVKRLKLELVCDEEATYRQGTDIRTEARTVYNQVLLREKDVDIKPGHPFEYCGSFRVPKPAMHSFQAPQNAVSWNLVVQANPAGWPRIERKFPIIVYPDDCQTTDGTAD